MIQTYKVGQRYLHTSKLVTHNWALAFEVTHIEAIPHTDVDLITYRCLFDSLNAEPIGGEDCFTSWEHWNKDTVELSEFGYALFAKEKGL